MIELSANNAAAWLARNGIPADGARFADLGGGVSNKVVLAEGPGLRAVIKQSLGKLRVEREWLSDRARIFREAAAMRWLAGKIRGGSIPKLLAEDKEEFAIAMEAAPACAEMWKTLLFRGEIDPAQARAAGVMLGSMIAASWRNAEAGDLFGDQTVFNELRIDPYYRFTARRHPDLASYFENLIRNSGSRRVSLVHGDWSPKNLLVSDGALWAIDWEVIHFGDPSFDVAFLINHLLLKTFVMPDRRAELAALAGEFLNALEGELPHEADWVPGAALEHLPALVLARVDGKSPAEYLNADAAGHARKLARDLMAHPADSVAKVFQR